MPYPRDSFTAIQRRVQNDLNAAIPGADAALDRSVLNGLAFAETGATHELYGFIAWAFDQMFASTADGQVLRDRHAAEYNLTPRPATEATGSVIFTGLANRPIPQGTRLQRADGQEYETTAVAEIDVSGSVSVAVESVNMGATTNTAPGTSLNLVSPVEGVTGTATVDTDGLGGGADEEGDEELRDRTLRRKRYQPGCGTEDDYINWSLELPGITQAWCAATAAGLGTVHVFFLVQETLANPNGIPNTTQVEQLRDHLLTRCPVTARNGLAVYAPATQTVNFQVRLRTTTGPSVQAAVVEELKDLIRREREPGGVLLLSHIRQTISNAAGEFDHQLVSPTADVTAAANAIFVYGTTTFLT